MGPKVRHAIDLLRGAGLSKRRISHVVCYVLYNYNKDTPEDLFTRVRDLLEWGVSAYPMRYQPLNGDFAFEKDSFVSPSWTLEDLEMVATARRVVGAGGALPPTGRYSKNSVMRKIFRTLLPCVRDATALRAQ